MEGPRDYRTKQSKTQRKINMLSLIYGILKKTKIRMNLFANQEQAHRHRKQIQSPKMGQWILGIGINIYTLLHIKQIPNMDLLYSTRNYTQYFAIIYKGKESEKNMYMYIYISYI